MCLKPKTASHLGFNFNLKIFFITMSVYAYDVCVCVQVSTCVEKSEDAPQVLIPFFYLLGAESLTISSITLSTSG